MEGKLVWFDQNRPALKEPGGIHKFHVFFSFFSFQAKKYNLKKVLFPFLTPCPSFMKKKPVQLVQPGAFVFVTTVAGKAARCTTMGGDRLFHGKRLHRQNFRLEINCHYAICVQRK